VHVTYGHRAKAPASKDSALILRSPSGVLCAEGGMDKCHALPVAQALRVALPD